MKKDTEKLTFFATMQKYETDGSAHEFSGWTIQTIHQVIRLTNNIDEAAVRLNRSSRSLRNLFRLFYIDYAAFKSIDPKFLHQHFPYFDKDVTSQIKFDQFTLKQIHFVIRNVPNLLSVCNRLRCPRETLERYLLLKGFTYSSIQKLDSDQLDVFLTTPPDIKMEVDQTTLNPKRSPDSDKENKRKRAEIDSVVEAPAAKKPRIDNPLPTIQTQVVQDECKLSVKAEVKEAKNESKMDVVFETPAYDMKGHGESDDLGFPIDEPFLDPDLFLPFVWESDAHYTSPFFKGPDSEMDEKAVARLSLDDFDQTSHQADLKMPWDLSDEDMMQSNLDHWNIFDM